MKHKLLQFGAGNIGRSFVAQLFSLSGYEVVFVDIDQRLINALNTENKYRVVIKNGNLPDETLTIKNVRAIDGRNTEAVIDEIISADIAATSVGQRALPIILQTLAKGIEQRFKKNQDRPLDIIIAENLQNAADFFHQELSQNLPSEFPLDEYVGLVETSIGKMVPIMKEEDLKEDPTWVFAEPYNQLILSKHAFKNPIPQIEGLKPVDNMQAYVDRKLYIHNLGHAAVAYLGFKSDPTHQYIWEALENPQTYLQTKQAMETSANALGTKYPDAFSREELQDHIEDLLNRFQNKALGDTIYRVGRDLHRKLSRKDRVIGSILLAQSMNLPIEPLIRVANAALHFKATDEQNQSFKSDLKFHQNLKDNGIEETLKSVCSLDPSLPLENKILQKLID